MFHICQKPDRRGDSGQTEDLQMYTEENKLVLTLVPLQLRKAANCGCLDYFHYNLIPDFKRKKEKIQ